MAANTSNLFMLLALHLSQSSSLLTYSKPPETYESKYIDCPSNEAEIDFYKHPTENLTDNVYWTDYVRAYEGGPFVNWLEGDANMGQIEASFGFGNNNSSENEMCAVADIRTQKLMPKNCDLKYPRPCYVPDLNIYNDDFSIYKIKYSRREKNVLFFRVDLQIYTDNTWCFTDSTSFYPERTNITLSRISNISLEIGVKTTGDGYYWCGSKMIQSEKILYIEDETKYGNGYAIMVNYNRALNKWLPYVTNYKLIKNLTCPSGDCEMFYDWEQDSSEERESTSESLFESSGESSGSSESTPLPVDDGFFSLGQFPKDEMHVKRVYANKILVHVFEGTEKIMYQYMRRDIIFMRKLISCESILNLPETKIGENTVTKDCNVYSCEGDFNMGSFWNISTDPDCHFSFDDELKSSDDQVNDVLKTIDTISAAPVNPTNLTSAANMIESVLTMQEDVMIPSKIFQGLETAVSNVMLPQNVTQLKIVQTNMAIVVADGTDRIPIIGIKVNSTERGFLNSSVHLLNSDSVIEEAEKNYIIVNISSLLTTRPRARLSFVMFQNGKPFQQEEKDDKEINSPVLSISVGNLSNFQKDEYLDIHFRPYNDREGSGKVCVFWDFNLGHNGQWSREGCQLLPKPTAAGLDTCRCHHLTYFAQLITRDDRSISRANYFALTLISFIGCVLSLIGLIIIGFTGFLFESWRNDIVHNLWMHLSGAVAIMIVSFLFASCFDFRSKSEVFCVISGVILHYSVVATFCWMLAAAAFYFQMTVKVFESRSSTDGVQKLKAILIGWLLPAVPIILLLFFDIDSYTQGFSRSGYQHEFCYPSGNGFWLAVFLPVLLIVISNTLLFLYILRSIYVTSQIKKHAGDNRRLLRSIKTLFILFYQFGLIWVFGLLSNYLVMAYLFCISATLQGLVLCFFFVAGNQNTRRLWLMKLNFIKTAKFPTTTLNSLNTNSDCKTKKKHNNRSSRKCEIDSIELPSSSK